MNIKLLSQFVHVFYVDVKNRILQKLREGLSQRTTKVELINLL